MDINSLEPNSHKYRQEKKPVTGDVPKKKIEKVISGTATLKKRGLGRRFMDVFFTGSGQDVKSYLIFDVLIPAIKETINNMINKGTEMILFGESSRPAKKVSGNYVSYSSSFKGEREKIAPSRQNRMIRRFDDIKFESRADAEHVIDILAEVMSIYNQATIGDLYDAVGITPDWTDNVEEYGWTDLSGTHVSRIRDGYILEMPKCIKL